MRELFRIRDYRLLWTGQAASNFGDALTNLALLLTTQRLTGSTAAVATTAIAIALPTLLFGLVAGAYVDRWNRKRVMIVSDLFRTSFVLAFLLVTTVDRMWILYVVAFIQASLGTFFTPAKSAYLPRIVGADHLMSANSVSQMTQIVFGLIGTAAAGVIASLNETLALAYIIDAGTFVISLAAISLVRTDASPHRTETVATTITSDIRVGLRVLAESRLLRGVMLGAGVMMLGIGATNVLLVPLIVEDLMVPETWFAGFEGAQVFSMVVASAITASLARRFGTTNLIVGGVFGIGVAVAAISTVSAPWQLIIIMFMAGWAIAPLQAAASTLVQTEVDDSVRGRTGSALNTVLTGANVVSMAFAGTLAAGIGVRNVFLVSGAIAVVAAGLAAWMFRGAVPKADAMHLSGAPEPAVAPAE
jgi:MFS family permease